ncbi:MAG: IS4 family transposase [Proteobacteria bacterium]|nr:IS4 family transposase [Pseudomonadota bacterium]
MHPRERFMKPAVERGFRHQLASSLGDDCCPIIITDAGFHNPRLRAVDALGWDYLCLIRRRVMLAAAEQDDWVQARSLFPTATTRAKALTKSRLSRAEPHACRFVIVKQKRRYRHDVNCYKKHAAGHYSNQQARAQREPWLLATSLPTNTAAACKRVVRAYTTRMHIEESFRDIKSEQFGYGYRLSRSKNIERIETLLLIALLAMLIAWIIGLRTIATDTHRRYQATTVKTRAALSTVYLGRRVWIRSDPFIEIAQWRLAFDAIRHLIEQHGELL